MKAVAFYGAVILGVAGCAAESSRWLSWSWPEPAPAMRPSVGSYEQEPLPKAYAPLVIADFDLSGHVTNAGQPFGGWDSDPGDRTQFCRVRLVDAERIGIQGFGVMLEYDVDSPNPAFNGFWMKLPNVSVRAFEALSVSIKGDAERGFTTRVWLELKGHSQVARFRLDGITAEWQQMRIPLREFDGIRRVKEANEFVIVFDDQTVTEKVGVLYLDDVAFEPT